MPETLLVCAPLIEALPDPTILVGADRRILLANGAAREMFSTQLTGTSILTYLRQPECVAALERGFGALDGAAVFDPFEGRISVAGQSSETILRVQISLLPRNFAIPSMLVTLRDISQLEDAEQQRRDFVANVSHELRSPLTVLSGFIETLKGPARDDPAARATFLDIMDREAQRMSRLVSDLLSLSKVESEERVRPRDRVSLGDILRTTIAALQPQSVQAGLSVNFQDMPTAPGIAGDHDQLVQVFHNLIENALKYGGTGPCIDIRLTAVGRVPGLSGPLLQVDVQDYGEGIDPIHVPRLTERFYRIDGHRARSVGGTGLGLAIVKHIVNRHRGRLIIRSARGEGSTVSVLLPIS